MKKITVKRSRPMSKNDHSQKAEVIEEIPEVECEFDHTKFALRRMMEIAEGYQTEIQYLAVVQGNIADLNLQNQMMKEFIENHIDMDEDEE